MNRLLLPLLLFAIATLHSSCGEHGHDATGHADQASTPPDSAPAMVNDALPSVSLDNGQRWKANPETTSGIATMVAILGAYDPATDDPTVLKDALEAEFGLIFERCTMEGEAHNQLHNYLLPMHHQLRDFAASKAQCSSLAKHLAAYGDYFE
ncbi:MAG TPA: hypothetical protein PLR96_03480 [Flavobacteriales bacterium]|nr:hypothetical protein [Flavobacteriales bacterium]HOY28009.1 hypothetical protein [Flavobacteriales bacterium]